MKGIKSRIEHYLAHAKGQELYTALGTIVALILIVQFFNNFGSYVSADDVGKAQSVGAFYTAEIALASVAARSETEKPGRRALVLPNNAFAGAPKADSEFDATRYRGESPVPLAATRRYVPTSLLHTRGARIAAILRAPGELCGEASFAASGLQYRICRRGASATEVAITSAPSPKQIPLPGNADRKLAGQVGFRLPDSLTCFYAYSLPEHDRYGLFSDVGGDSVLGSFVEHSTQCDDSDRPNRSKVEQLGRMSTSFIINGGHYRLGDFVPMGDEGAPLIGEFRMEIWNEADTTRPVQILTSNGKIDVRRFFDPNAGTLFEIGPVGSRRLGVKACIPLHRPLTLHRQHFSAPDRGRNPFGAFDQWSRCADCKCAKSANRIGKKWKCQDPSQLCQ